MKLLVVFSVLLLNGHISYPPSLVTAVEDEGRIKLPCMMRGKRCERAGVVDVDDPPFEQMSDISAKTDISDIEKVLTSKNLSNGLSLGENANLKMHPFIEAVEQDCSAEIKRCGNGKISPFYSTIACLEKLHTKGKLGDKCEASVFSRNAANPNEHIFSHDEDWEFPATLQTQSGETVFNGTFYYGLLNAPLFYSKPDQTPLTPVMFGYIPCRTQPAPRGLLFQHNGGPSAGLTSYVLPAGFYENIYDNYDFVMIDQRGMGLSAVFNYYGAQDLASWDIDTIAYFSGLFGQGGLYVNGDFAGPCYDVLQEYVDINEPQDYTDEDAMVQYLLKKQEATVKCSKVFDRRDDETGTEYNVLQYFGTQALSYDIEWLRMAFGFPKVSILGFSYGSRVAADYLSRFPQNVLRAAVSGVMAPDPNALSYAKKAAANTAEIFGFLQSRCNEAGEECMSNPFPKNSTDYFSGDANEALTELFRRSAPGSTFYAEKCGEGNSPVPLRFITAQLSYRLTSMIYSQGDFLNSAWPRAMLEIPALIFAMLQNPCLLKELFVYDSSVVNAIQVFYLIPALDMTGDANAKQVARFIATHAKDTYFSPGLVMFSLYAYSAFGWPQVSTPIAFSNPDVDVAIGQALYDQRTGMNMAQDFARNFPKSRMAVAPVSGHCVSASHGPEASDVIMRFLLFSKEFSNGVMTDMPPKPMPFEEVAADFVNGTNDNGLGYYLKRWKDETEAQDIVSMIE